MPRRLGVFSRFGASESPRNLRCDDGAWTVASGRPRQRRAQLPRRRPPFSLSHGSRQLLTVRRLDDGSEFTRFGGSTAAALAGARGWQASSAPRAARRRCRLRLRPARAASGLRHRRPRQRARAQRRHGLPRRRVHAASAPPRAAVSCSTPRPGCARRSSPTCAARASRSPPDGAGGYYIGGAVHAPSAACRARNLAHVLADGGVDPAFAPQIDGDVLTLLLSQRPACTSAATSCTSATSSGAGSRRWTPSPARVIDGFNPGADKSVQDLAISGNRLFVDGRFTGIAGQSRSFIAVLDATNGKLDPNFDAVPNGQVDAVLALGTRFYIGGAFTEVSGRSRAGLAAFDVATGELDTGFSPSTNGNVYNISTDGTRLFVGGRFTEISRSFNNSVASLDPITGEASQDFRLFLDKDAYTLADPRRQALHRRRVHEGQRAAAPQAGGRRSRHGSRRPGLRPRSRRRRLRRRADERAPRGGREVHERPAHAGVAPRGHRRRDRGDPRRVRGRHRRPRDRARGRGRAALRGRRVQGGQRRQAPAARRVRRGAPARSSALDVPVDGAVNTIAPAGERLYVGGSSTRPAAGCIRRVAAIDLAANKVVAALQRAEVARERRGCASRSIRALVPLGRRLLAGGEINVSRTIKRGGSAPFQFRSGLIALRTGDGTIDFAFNAHTSGGVAALVLERPPLYVGGSMSRRSGTKLVAAHVAQEGPQAQAAQGSDLPQQPRRARGPQRRPRAPLPARRQRPGGGARAGRRPAVRRRARSRSSAGAGAAASPPSRASTGKLAGDLLAAAVGAGRPISALLTGGERVFAGGSFAAFGPVPRPNLAIFRRRSRACGRRVMRLRVGVPPSPARWRSAASARPAARRTARRALPDPGFGSAGLAADAVRRRRARGGAGRSAPSAIACASRATCAARAARARSSRASGAAGTLDTAFNGSGARARSLRRCGAARRSAARGRRARRDGIDARRGRRGSADHGRALPARRRASTGSSARAAWSCATCPARPACLEDGGLAAIALTPAGQVVVAGSVGVPARDPYDESEPGEQVVVGRLTDRGVPDPSFGDAGFALLQLGARSARRPARSRASALALLPDGSLVVGGAGERDGRLRARRRRAADAPPGGSTPSFARARPRARPARRCAPRRRPASSAFHALAAAGPTARCSRAARATDVRRLRRRRCSRASRRRRGSSIRASAARGVVRAQLRSRPDRPGRSVVRALGTRPQGALVARGRRRRSRRGTARQRAVGAAGLHLRRGGIAGIGAGSEPAADAGRPTVRSRPRRRPTARLVLAGRRAGRRSPARPAARRSRPARQAPAAGPGSLTLAARYAGRRPRPRLRRRGSRAAARPRCASSLTPLRAGSRSEPATARVSGAYGARTVCAA